MPPVRCSELAAWATQGQMPGVTWQAGGYQQRQFRMIFSGFRTDLQERDDIKPGQQHAPSLRQKQLRTGTGGRCVPRRQLSGERLLRRGALPGRPPPTAPVRAAGTTRDGQRGLHGALTTTDPAHPGRGRAEPSRAARSGPPSFSAASPGGRTAAPPAPSLTPLPPGARAGSLREEAVGGVLAAAASW